MLQLFVDALTEIGFAEEVVDNVEALLDGLLIFQREDEPAAQQSATHRRYGTVYHVEERLAVLLHGTDQLQRSDGKLVETHVAFLLDTGDASNMTYLGVQRLFQILQDGSSSHYPTLQMVDAKALQRLHVEVLI